MRRITSTKHQTPGTKLKVFTRRRISVKDGQTLKLIWECADLKISGYLLINFPLRATGNNLQPETDNNPYSLNLDPFLSRYFCCFVFKSEEHDVAVAQHYQNKRKVESEGVSKISKGRRDNCSPYDHGTKNSRSLRLIITKSVKCQTEDCREHN
jgi:hypothetical protein